MSGYRRGYSEEHSPYYEAGLADGRDDAARLNSRPPVPARGPDPIRAWSVMYVRGYWDGLAPGTRKSF